MIPAIAATRLRNQYIGGRFRGSVEDLVRRLGAVQAQEFPFARWALGLRLSSPGDARITDAFDTGRILRTHVMRPTWHFVTREDIRWMLELTGPRVQRVVASYVRREGLEPRLLSRAVSIMVRALEGGRSLTRAELRARLAEQGIATTAMKMGFVMMYAELERVVCSGPRRDREFTYALLDERAPDALRLDRDAALAALTSRYFTSHGPATIRDFVWWSGLTVGDTRRGLDIVGARRETIDGLDYWSMPSLRRIASPPEGVHLLPIYDEYLVAYRDRVAVPHGPGTPGKGPSPVMFKHPLVSAGAVAGTWNMRTRPDGYDIDVTPMRALTRAERDGIAAAAERYGRFVGRPVRVKVG